jgi:hypothetical protein
VKVAIMQPTFLPWLGYINLMATVDTFVYLDDVQISPKSFMTRNRIPKGENSFHWLSIRENKISKIEDRFLNNTQITDIPETFKSISEDIKNSYKESKFRELFIDKLHSELSSSHSIADINIGLIGFLLDMLEIDAKTIRSSSLNVKGSKSEKVLNILNNFNWTSYVAVPGAVEYMREDPLWLGVENKLEIYNYEPTPYKQSKSKEFMPFMSSVDAILELGAKEARKVMLSGSQPPLPW